MGGPCAPWIEASELACSDLDGAVLEESIQVASDLLYVLSGRQFQGICTDVVRPCSKGAFRRRYASPSNAWYETWGFCGCSYDACGCSSLHQIELPGQPVIEVTQVKMHGDIVSPSTYRVDDRRFLVRVTDTGTGQNDGFMCCQRLDLPATEDDTFEVTYTFGIEPPASGVRAANALACEFANLFTGGPDCRLPKRVQSVSRAGITILMMDPFAALDEGRMGILEVDLFLAAYNPGNRRASASVLSPDIGPKARRTR